MSQERPSPPKRLKMDPNEEIPTTLSLAIPFLAAGDLPNLAAVSKAAKLVAIAALKARLKRPLPSERNDSGVIQKQGYLSYPESSNIPPCYNKQAEIDLRRIYFSLPFFHLKEGRWFLRIQNKNFVFPENKLSRTNVRFHHCSVVNSTVLVVACVEGQSEERQMGGAPRDLYAILYNFQSTSPLIEASSIQSLALNVDYFHALGNTNICTIDPMTFPHMRGFGWTVRSADTGDSFAVLTDVGTSQLGGTHCTLSIFQITTSDQECAIQKKQDLFFDWDHIDYSHLDACFSPCGQVLSVRRVADSVHWVLFKLNALSLFEECFNTTFAHELDEIYFTADGEVVLEGDHSHPSRVASDFRFLEDTPVFCRKVVILAK